MITLILCIGQFEKGRGERQAPVNMFHIVNYRLNMGSEKRTASHILNTMLCLFLQSIQSGIRFPSTSENLFTFEEIATCSSISDP